MKEFFFYAFLGFLLAALIWIIVSGAIIAREEKEEDRSFLYEKCQYLGSRVETGWGGGTILRFDCDGVIEERRKR